MYYRPLLIGDVNEVVIASTLFLLANLLLKVIRGADLDIRNSVTLTLYVFLWLFLTYIITYMGINALGIYKKEMPKPNVCR